MLIQNRCWLCEQPFQRGKMKKVFQLSEVLEFFLTRVMEEQSNPENLPSPFHSKNLRECFLWFRNFIQITENGEPNTERVVEEIRKNDLETWMSGMVCGASEECEMELSYFIKSFDPKQKNEESSKRFKTATMNAKDCPPGCNCDNPWPFLT